MTLNWPLLKSNKCPKSGHALKARGVLQPVYVCSAACGFEIGCDRFDQVVANLYKPVSKRRSALKEQRLSELNNDDRKVQSEDFASSPFADRVEEEVTE